MDLMGCMEDMVRSEEIRRKTIIKVLSGEGYMVQREKKEGNIHNG